MELQFYHLLQSALLRVLWSFQDYKERERRRERQRECEQGVKEREREKERERDRSDLRERERDRERSELVYFSYYMKVEKPWCRTKK